MSSWSWPWRRRAPRAERWIVLDVETTGLDPAVDRLLALAAVALHVDGGTPRVALADSFAAVLRAPSDHDAALLSEADKANILLHGIGLGAQRAGAPAPEVLRAFAAWAGDAPRLGYHVAFDRAVIERAERSALGAPQPARWLDIEPLAAVAHGGGPPAPLDTWLRRYAIPCLQRHQAAADTLATAELLQQLWPRLQREGARDFAGLQRLAAQRRWVGQGA